MNSRQVCVESKFTIGSLTKFHLFVTRRIPEDSNYYKNTTMTESESEKKNV